MRSNLGRLRRTSSRSLIEQLATLTSVGDGSTLSLDFTTGVLDPRLTFDRLSTATFINSSGLVQFANANLMTYSTPRASGSAWQTTGTVTWGSATITDPLGNATAQEVTFGTVASAIFNTSGTTVVSGITHTFSVWLRAASGTTNVRIGDANVGAVSTVTLTTTWQRFSCQYVASGTNDGGAIYSQTGTPSSTVYVWGAQVQPGSIVGELLETTGTLRRNIPRFDYDPNPTSIGTPRGLLIEGSASNLLFWSESFATSGAASNWGYSGNTGATVTTDNPAGGMTAFQFAETANSGPLLQSAAVTNVVHTFSAWFKGSIYNSVTTTQVQFGLYTTAFVAGTASIISGPGSTSVAGNIVTLSGLSTTQWTRVQFTTSAAISGGAVAPLIYPQSTAFEVNRSFYIWGAMLEQGSGASSYIPSGASQGSRAADSCSLSLASIPFSTAEGSFFVRYEAPRATLGNAGQSVLNTDYQATEWVGLFQSFNSLTVSLGSWSGQSNIANGTLSTNSAAFSYGAWNGSVVPTSFAANNSAVTNANRDWNPSMPTWLLIGAASSVGASTANRDWLNGCIRTVKYWPTRLPDAQIRNLTT